MVGLAKAGDDEGACGQARVARRAVLGTVEDHVLVHLVADQQHIGGGQQAFELRISAAVQMVALGLCGLLTIISARARRDGGGDLAKSGRKCRASAAPHDGAAGQLDIGHVAVVAGSSTITSSPPARWPGWR
jgi:hypothetical protein